MRRTMTWLVIALTLGGSLETLPAEAAMLRVDGLTVPAATPVEATASRPGEARFELVRGRGGSVFRHGGGRRFGARGFRGRHFGERGFGGRHYGYGRYRGYGYRHHGGVGAALAGAAVGVAAGAIVGGAIARHNDGAVRSCEARFRSYDPRSGTYLGTDGRRHACP